LRPLSLGQIQNEGDELILLFIERRHADQQLDGFCRDRLILVRLGDKGTRRG
jgi:hypothetical protein